MLRLLLAAVAAFGLCFLAAPVQAELSKPNESFTVEHGISLAESLTNVDSVDAELGLTEGDVLDEEHFEFRRFLADEKKKEKESGRIDYSVLSVTVMTLGLILVVEVLRHRLDHAALGRPYFTAVLENIYAELTTLGIVEFCVFLLQEYHKDMDKEKKDVFGAVHFALFYTAIFNAFQSIFLCFITTRVSQKLWVQTEALDLSHYVEIREEFERVQAQIRRIRPRSASNASPESSTVSDDEAVNRVDKGTKTNSQDNDEYHSEYVFEVSWRGLKSVFAQTVELVRYPRLIRQYNKLLVQVRFHELRVHFLLSNNLPAKLSVSDYLIRCEQKVLIKLAHVSAFAWLLLTASINLLYYILGIVGTETEDQDIVGTSLTYIFFVCMGLFVILAMLVQNKMKSIFRTIMHREELWQSNLDDTKTQRELASEQRNLFWAGSPNLVIAAIQFMQFGYAIALAAVIMFWQEVNTGDIGMEWYWIVIMSCYSLFVLAAAEIIPRYTMCCSLGQLVDKKNLDSTVANFHLEEAKLRLSEAEALKTYNEHHNAPVLLTGSQEASVAGDSIQARRERRKQVVLSDGVSVMTEAETLSRVSRSTMRPRRQKSKSEGVASMATMTSVDSGNNSERIAALVNLDTKSLRQVVSVEGLDKAEDDDSSRKTPPRWRRSRSSSDSQKILKMRDGEAEDELPAVAESSAEMFASGRSFRRKMASDGVQYLSTGEMPPVLLDTNALEVSGPLDNEDSDSQSNLSDMDDMPTVNEEMYNLSHAAEPAKLSVKESVKAYFMSKSSRVTSHVFGTLVAFFMIGLRVEKFMHSEGIVSSKFITFGLDKEASFWLLTVWFGFFIVSDLAIFWSLGLGNLSKKERRLQYAASFDLAITSVCLIVFMCGEMRRCCTESDEVEDVDYTYDPYPAPCSCPKFGSRTYGGLGTLEPYISLICLRLFRFIVAKKLYKFQQKDSNAHKHSMNDATDEDINLDAFAHDDNHNGNHGDHHGGHDDHGHGHGSHTRGTATELWEVAISENPEVAEKYGVFSGEILQIMLGIPAVEHVHEIVKEEFEGKKPVETGVTLASFQRKGTFEEPRTKKDTYTLDKKYSNLPVASQEVIMAGKLGRNVRCVTDNILSDGSIPEHSASKAKSRYLFEIKDDQKNIPDHVMSLEEISFEVPNASLVRTMRRCDKKLLPILEKWTPVDVVMTRFEIVYFDASEFVRSAESEAVEQALIATKCGKGLRLSDVARGRKVVGHVRLSEITSLAVERYISGVNAEHEEEGPDIHLTDTEFWKKEKDHDHVHEVRDWSSKTQDTLAMHTSGGHTVYLRFYADFEDSAMHPERLGENNDIIHKNNAFQWIQTIGRFCGPDQLHQKLPHFGEDSEEELRDYLVVHCDPAVKNKSMLAAQGPRMKRELTVAETAVKHETSFRNRQSLIMSASRHRAYDLNLSDDEALPRIPSRQGWGSSRNVSV